MIDELEKNESLDKKLLRYLTVKVKKFDLETNYFSTRKDDVEKRTESKIQICQKERVEIKKVNKATLQN